MKTIETLVEYQSDFPLHDLTQENSDILSLYLANQRNRQAYSEKAHNSQSALRNTLHMLDILQKPVYDLEQDTRHGLLVGAQAMIATCMTVNPHLSYIHIHPKILDLRETISPIAETRAFFLQDIYNTFTHDFPNSATVVENGCRQDKLSGTETTVAVAAAGLIQIVGSRMLASQHKPIASMEQ